MDGADSNIAWDFKRKEIVSPELVYGENSKSLGKIIVVAKEEPLRSAIPVHQNQSRRVLSLKSDCIDEAGFIADRPKPAHFRTRRPGANVHLLLDVGSSAPFRLPDCVLSGFFLLSQA